MATKLILSVVVPLALAGPFLTSGAGAAQTARRPVTAAQLPTVVYTAHRGGALEAPENSMSALRAAFTHGRSQVLDFDTRMLRDGTLVVMHDATLDRTTDKTGPVRDLTAAGWRRVRLVPPPGLPGHWRPERPPTLAGVLDAFGGRAVLTMEAKDPDSVPAITKELKRRGLTRSVFVNSNDPAVAREVHRRGLMAQLWRSREQMRHDRPERWRGVVDVLDVDYRARDSDLLRFAASGVPRVWAHTVNTARDRDRVERLGCDGFVTDAPTLLTRTADSGPVRAEPGARAVRTGP
jgi:glycerophosphoryl diester phosphodiesterase